MSACVVIDPLTLTEGTDGNDARANDVGYIATVQMGTPPRDFKLLMDSGSADLWVGAENCVSQAGGGCVSHLMECGLLGNGNDTHAALCVLGKPRLPGPAVVQLVCGHKRAFRGNLWFRKRCG